MEISTIIPHIEALIFASDKPLSAPELTEHVNNALGFIEDRASLEQVESAVEGIQEKYDSEFYAFELKQSGGGWQFLTKPEYHKTVALINGDKFIKKLSNAALETLAIIAYKQPITKSEIESIRGVNCDYAVQKLLEKDLVIISGRNEDAVGKPLIYNTSKSFMDYFGINSADDLPKIREVLMEEYANATSLSDILEEQDAVENGTPVSPEAILSRAEDLGITVTEETIEEVIVNTGELINTGELVEEELVEEIIVEKMDMEEGEATTEASADVEAEQVEETLEISEEEIVEEGLEEKEVSTEESLDAEREENTGENKTTTEEDEKA